jgi:hypothetical protein
VIVVGIDDTDTADSPGTNQLARVIVREVDSDWQCARIVRHQLLFDPRIPYTSKNGSASISFTNRGDPSLQAMQEICERVMRNWFVVGSDPGLCIAVNVPPEVIEFGKRCQREIVTQQAARSLAASHNVVLRGLGGTEGGIIGALAAVGLAETGDDGRVVQQGEWPDDLSGRVTIESLQPRDIDVIESYSLEPILSGMVDVGRHLRPNRRAGRTVLYVQPESFGGEIIYRALKLT